MTRISRHLARVPAAIVVAILLVVATISARTQVAAPQQTPAAATQKSFIWEIQRGGQVAWMVGSLHLATPEFYPLPPAMQAAFARADTLVEEIDMEEANKPEFAAVLLSKAVLPAGTTLQSQISADTYARVNDWFMKSGLPLAPFQQMKPWMVSITIQTLALQKIGFDPAHGIDKHFRDAANAAGKRFMALETAEQQIDFMDQLSPKTQDLMLRESVESMEKELAEIKTLASAWRGGDAATVERVALSGFQDAPEVYKSLLVDRNRRWIPAIESCMQTRACFIVVGAAHLVGPEGLIVLLRERGYSVEQR